MTKNAKIFIGLVVILIVIWAGYKLAGPEAMPNANEPVKLGFIAPLSGDTAGLGENIRLAGEIARDEINQAGGIKGRQLEVIFEDGQCDPKAATSAGTKLLQIDKVTAIVGGFCSSETLAVAPLANAAKIPLVSSSSTNPKITQAGDYVFRFVPSDSFQGKFAAEYLTGVLNKKKVGILYCLTDWCVGLKDVFKARLAELGGEVAAEEGYQQEARDLRSQITKIKAAKAEIVYFLGYTEGTIVGLKQMKELGVNLPIFGGDTWDDPKIITGVGEAAEGAMYSITANRALPQSFVDEMNKRSGGKESNTYSPRVYDIFKALAQIMDKVGVDSEKIKNELYQVKDYQGIADTYTLDANGDVSVANYIVKAFMGGKVVEIK